MKKLSKPIIYKVNYSREDAQNLDDKIRKNGNIKGEEQKYLIDYPTVYVIASEKSKLYTVYVGETNNIKRRTLEHIDVDSEVRE
ncbi:GIY-YIG nuclease family protein, partial [Ligilactobacillus agilis]|uniref:GIY-YIG nuclease family protein n=1 Tax=Ligilactobacillus agilis TaxID=1601 RepID=UPI00265CD2AD